MSRLTTIATGTALVAVLGFMQLEIATIHEDVQDVKEFLVKSNEKMNYSKTDFDCMAKNIYHEAGIESQRGKFAVAQVTLNRLKDGRWGKSICKVVYAPSQFSWTLYRKQRYEQPKGPLWNESVAVTRAVLEKGYRVPSLDESILYHADYIKEPVWAASVVRIQHIGQHIFYKKA